MDLVHSLELFVSSDLSVGQHRHRSWFPDTPPNSALLLPPGLAVSRRLREFHAQDFDGLRCCGPLSLQALRGVYAKKGSNNMKAMVDFIRLVITLAATIRDHMAPAKVDVEATGAEADSVAATKPAADHIDEADHRDAAEDDAVDGKGAAAALADACVENEGVGEGRAGGAASS